MLLDLDMLATNGWDFVHAYRQSPLPHALIIVRTALSDGAQHAATLQVAGHVRKPFDLDHLLDLVEHHRCAYAAAEPSG